MESIQDSAEAAAPKTGQFVGYRLNGFDYDDATPISTGATKDEAQGLALQRVLAICDLDSAVGVQECADLTPAQFQELERIVNSWAIKHDLPGAKKDGSMVDSVTRYVATYVNKDGERTLMAPAQGRNTHETPEAAQAWIDAVTANNNSSTVADLWGANPRFEVRPCPCYPGHFDPQTVWFSLEKEKDQ